jgi:pimeloyl-ACP methyl ester carboxylesterase
MSTMTFARAGIITASFGGVVIGAEHLPPAIRRKTPPTMVLHPGADPWSDERVFAWPGMQGNGGQIEPLLRGLGFADTMIVEAGSDVRHSSPAALRAVYDRGWEDKLFTPLGVSMGGILAVRWLRLALKHRLKVFGAIIISSPATADHAIWGSNAYRHGSRFLRGGLQSGIIWQHMNLTALLELLVNLKLDLATPAPQLRVLAQLRGVAMYITAGKSRRERAERLLWQLGNLRRLLGALAELGAERGTAAYEVLEIWRCMNIPSSQITSSANVLRCGAELLPYEFNVPLLYFERKRDHRVNPCFEEGWKQAFADAVLPPRRIFIEVEGHAKFHDCWELYTDRIKEWHDDVLSVRRGRIIAVG